MTNHYQIPLPAVVSFSGGRTSGFMLRQILDAYGGQPDGLKIAFQNTGLEAEATLVFVRECSERWSCEIVWLEYLTDAANRPSFKVVNFDTASRSGEPFDAVIDKKKFLPNPVARICTQELKVLTMARWLKTVPGFEESYTNAVGLRADEPRRAIRVLGDNKRDMACPLYRAGITNDDVLTFWAANDFDLRQLFQLPRLLPEVASKDRDAYVGPESSGTLRVVGSGRSEAATKRAGRGTVPQRPPRLRGPIGNGSPARSATVRRGHIR